MIPILFDSSSTTFTTNGIGRLIDCISCEVTEERNGEYSLVMVYLATGEHAEYLINSNIIVAKPNKEHSRQAFRIYKVSKPFNQKITVYANHISYDANYIPVAPFEATGITATINGLASNSLETNPFTITTDITNETSVYSQTTPKSLRGCLGGTDQSVLATFSGSGGVEYEWDNYSIFATLNRGADNGVSIRYGKNLTDIVNDIDVDNVVTGVLPYWTNQDNTIVYYGDVQHSSYASLYPFNRTVPLDLSSEFSEQPTASQLNEAGASYLEDTSLGVPTENIKISFVDLTDTQEYKDIAVLEQVNLCDTVHVYYSALNLNTSTKVIKTHYDVLRERYIDIELGDTKSELAKTLADTIGDVSSIVTSNDKLISVTRTLDTELGEAQTTISTLETRVTTAESDIDSIEGDVTTLTTTVETNTTNITQNATSISALATRVTTAETEIDTAQSDIDTLEGNYSTLNTTVSTHTTLIQQNADAIELKADSTTVETISTGLSELESEVYSLGGAVGTDTYYQASDSGTEVPTGTWYETVSETGVTQGQYLWVKTVTYYGTNKESGTGNPLYFDNMSVSASDSEVYALVSDYAYTTDSYTVSYIGTDGVDGEDGAKGDKGDTGETGAAGADGADGVSVVSIKPIYYLSDSSVTAPTLPTSEVTSTSTSSGVWTTVLPSYLASYNYWTSQQTEFSDGTFDWSEAILDVTFDTLITTTTANSASIQELDDRVETNATSVTTINRALNNLGGRNLWIGSADFSVGSYRGTIQDDTYNNTQVLYGDVEASQLLSDMTSFLMSTDPFTLSFYAKGTSVSVNAYEVATTQGNPIELDDVTITATESELVVGAYTSTSSNVTISTEDTISSDWQKMTYTVTFGENATTDIALTITGEDLYLCSIKFETGTVATYYTPAPEDVESEIKETQSATLTVASNTILATVSDTYATTEYVGNVQQTIESGYSSAIEQSASSLTATFTSKTDDLESRVEANEETVAEVNTYFTFDSNGLGIATSESGMKMQLDNDSLDFIQNDTTITWIDGAESVLGARELSLGEPSGDRFRLLVSGNHLRITKHS